MSSEDAYLGLDPAVAEDAQVADALAVAERIEKDDLKLIMSNAAGRRFMWWLLSECRVFHSSFSTSALEMARREGRRELGLQMVERLNLFCPERYEEMRKEQISGRRRGRRGPDQTRSGAVDQ